MPGIVSAIRGGPDSQATITTSIQLAKQTELPLYFLYVVNLDFFAHTTRSRFQTVLSEMEAMGEFILLTARARADAEGLQASGVVRQGQVIEEVIALCQEIEAQYVVLGQPRGQVESDLLVLENLRQIKERIQKETQAKLILAGGAE